MSSVWQSAFIHANGVRLHYTRTGGSKPPVILAHGVTDDGLCWTPVAEVLAPDYDVIMIDARGHGRSDAPPEGYTSIEQADDLAGLIRALDLKSPIVLGHSMGAQTALMLAARHPQLPRALQPRAIALEDPPPWWDPDHERPYNAEWQARMQSWIVPLRQQPRAAVIAAQRAAEPSWSDAELEPWADAKYRFNLNYFHNLRDPELDWDTVLRAVQCPVLLITGDVDEGALVSSVAVRLFQQYVPQVQIAHIAGAGHSIRRYQFVAYMQVVRAFLADPGRSR
jgi:N-formylmaleamate deformylase